MDINDKIAENTGLIYQQLHKFSLIDDQDAESFAWEALYKAVISFRPEEGNKFSTYAVCVIANALRNHVRTKSRKRQLDVISYDKQLDDGLYLVDTLSTHVTTEDEYFEREKNKVVNCAYCKAISELSERHHKIIEMWQDGATQRETARELGVSQPLVSQVISSFKYRLRKELEEYM